MRSALQARQLQERRCADTFHRTNAIAKVEAHITHNQAPRMTLQIVDSPFPKYLSVILGDELSPHFSMILGAGTVPNCPDRNSVAHPETWRHSTKDNL